MKCFVAARGLNDLQCPECGAKVADRASRCSMFNSPDEKRRCKWQPGFRAEGKFWPVTPTEADLSAEQLASLQANPDLVVVTEAMFKHVDPMDAKRR